MVLWRTRWVGWAEVEDEGFVLFTAGLKQEKHKDFEKKKLQQPERNLFKVFVVTFATLAVFHPSLGI